MDETVSVWLHRETVFGSAHEHLCASGSVLTLCGRLGEGWLRLWRRRPLCERCAREASKRGLAIRT